MTQDQYTFKIARSQAEVASYFKLRKAIFCDEQGIFDDSDRDEKDRHAYPIIAVNETQETVGVVRIYETEPRLWYGGRLGVHQDYRRVGSIGKGLIRQAVCTANSWGCDRFLATVQLPNVRFFRRVHWHSLEKITICDLPHHLMEADLEFYPSNNEIKPNLELV